MQAQSTQVQNVKHLSELGSPHGRYLANILIVDAIATTSIGSSVRYTRDSIRRRRARSYVTDDNA